MLQPIMLIFIVTKFIVAASLLISAKLVVAFTKTPVPRLMVERQITTVIMASINQGISTRKRSTKIEKELDIKTRIHPI